MLQTPMDELQLQLGMSNFIRSRWKLVEQTVIRIQINLVQHTKPNHTTSMTQWQETYRDKAWPPNTPGTQEAEGDI